MRCCHRALAPQRAYLRRKVALGLAYAVACFIAAGGFWANVFLFAFAMD